MFVGVRGCNARRLGERAILPEDLHTDTEIIYILSLICKLIQLLRGIKSGHSEENVMILVSRAYEQCVPIQPLMDKLRHLGAERKMQQLNRILISEWPQGFSS